MRVAAGIRALFPLPLGVGILLLGLVPAPRSQVSAEQGQSVGESFDRLYAAAVEIEESGGEEPEIRRAYDEALRVFLRIPTDAPDYRARLARAARAAAGAERGEMALELVAEARSRQQTATGGIGGEEEALLRSVHLWALWLVGDSEAFLAAAQSPRTRDPVGLHSLVARDRDGEFRLLAWADRWLREGRTEDGLWLFEAQAADGDPHALANLALALRNAGSVSQSEQAYRRARSRAPDDYVISNDYGLFLRAVGRPEEAVEVFRASYGKEPLPGDGPAITNLLQMALVRPDLVPEPPWPEATVALRLRPESAMLRRVTLDLLLAGRVPFPPSNPDREAPRR